MSTTCVLLADYSSRLRAIVESAVAGQQDLTVVGSAHCEVDVLLSAGRLHADVVIVEAAGKVVPAVAERLVDEYKEIEVLAVDADCDHALLYRLRPDTPGSMSSRRRCSLPLFGARRTITTISPVLR